MNRADRYHGAVSEFLESDPGPYFVPAGILAGVTYMLELRHSVENLDVFLSDLESGALTLDCGEHDFARVRVLVHRYADLPLGFSDAAVIACGERHGGCVLTLDQRHFGVVGREGTISLAPEL